MSSQVSLYRRDSKVQCAREPTWKIIKGPCGARHTGATSRPIGVLIVGADKVNWKGLLQLFVMVFKSKGHSYISIAGSPGPGVQQLKFTVYGSQFLKHLKLPGGEVQVLAYAWAWPPETVWHDRECAMI